MARLPIDQLEPADIVVVLEFTGICRRLTDFWLERMEGPVDQGVRADATALKAVRNELVRLHDMLE